MFYRKLSVYLYPFFIDEVFTNTRQKMKFKQNIIIKILPLFALFIAFSCSKGKPDGYEVKGKLQNIEGDSFFVSHERGDSIVIDTVAIDMNGNFSFQGKVDTLTTLCFYLNQKTMSPSYLYVFVDKGLKVEVEGDATLPDLINVTGGDINSDLTAFKKENEKLLRTRAETFNAALTDTVKTDKLSSEKYVMTLKNVNFELSNIAANYVKKNPDKIASVVLINNFFKDEASIPRLDENLDLLTGKALEYSQTRKLREYSSRVKGSAVGSQAPYVSLKDTNGKIFVISSVKDKYVLLSFLSTTCSVCDEEKAESIALYNEMLKKKENIAFVSVIKDIEVKSIKEAYSDSLKWTLLPEYGGWAGKTFALYNIHEIPYNILISPTGKILDRDLPLEKLTERLDELKKEAAEQKK